MEPATWPQIALFVGALGLIIASGYFIARPRK
jgi:hypothetical protein